MDYYWEGKARDKRGSRQDKKIGLTEKRCNVIFKLILSETLDPRLLGKISLTGVFYFFEKIICFTIKK